MMSYFRPNKRLATEGLSECYRKIAPQVKEIYKRNDHSTDADCLKR